MLVYYFTIKVPSVSSDECFDICLSTSDCKWFTFDSVPSACYLFENCPTLDETCISCVSSTDKCRGKTSNIYLY